MFDPPAQAGFSVDLDVLDTAARGFRAAAGGLRGTSLPGLPGALTRNACGEMAHELGKGVRHSAQLFEVVARRLDGMAEGYRRAEIAVLRSLEAIAAGWTTGRYEADEWGTAVRPDAGDWPERRGLPPRGALDRAGEFGSAGSAAYARRSGAESGGSGWVDRLPPSIPSARASVRAGGQASGADRSGGSGRRPGAAGAGSADPAADAAASGGPDGPAHPLAAELTAAAAAWPPAALRDVLFGVGAPFALVGAACLREAADGWFAAGAQLDRHRERAVDAAAAVGAHCHGAAVGAFLDRIGPVVSADSALGCFADGCRLMGKVCEAAT